LERLRTAGYELVFPSPGATPSEEQLARSIPACVGYLAGVEPISRELLGQCKALRVISRNGVGTNNIDLEAARDNGIAVETARGANARGVAELALTLTMCALRHIGWADREMKGGRWSRPKGTELRHRTLGIIGCGAIGKELAQMAMGLEMQVLAYDFQPDMSFAPGSGFRYGTMEEVLSESEVISLHVPAGDSPLIRRDALEQVKTGTILVNTARGELIEEQAVLEALDTGRLGAYATDVYRTEPPGASGLVEHDRVISTPHIGGYTEESVDRAAEMAVSNLLIHLE
jgi:D-3-phosphoglycerate dehydrogenase